MALKWEEDRNFQRVLETEIEENGEDLWELERQVWEREEREREFDR